MNVSLAAIKNQIRKFKDPKRAKASLWFFKTGSGDYGEGDKFFGLTSDQVKEIAKEFIDLKLREVTGLLKSKIHEERMTALRILSYKFARAKKQKNFIELKRIYDFYLKNAKSVNNWDLVDASADKIVGEYLIDKPKNILYKLAKSKNIWERRISIIATFQFIRAGNFKETLRIAKLLMNDKHDLIHKAVGWMLREIGKRDELVLEEFLKPNVFKLPRTSLRYAIERFPETKRKRYLLMR